MEARNSGEELHSKNPRICRDLSAQSPKAATLLAIASPNSFSRRAILRTDWELSVSILDAIGDETIGYESQRGRRPVAPDATPLTPIIGCLALSSRILSS